jgi:hypothetical protein
MAFSIVGSKLQRPGNVNTPSPSSYQTDGPDETVVVQQQPATAIAGPPPTVRSAAAVEADRQTQQARRDEVVYQEKDTKKHHKKRMLAYCLAMLFSLLLLCFLIGVLITSLRAHHYRKQLGKYRGRFSATKEKNIRVIPVDIFGTPLIPVNGSMPQDIKHLRVPFALDSEGRSEDCEEVDGTHECHWGLAKHGGFMVSCNERFLCNGPMVMEKFIDFPGHQTRGKTIYINPTLPPSNSSESSNESSSVSNSTATTVNEPDTSA